MDEGTTASTCGSRPVAWSKVSATTRHPCRAASAAAWPGRTPAPAITARRRSPEDPWARRPRHGQRPQILGLEQVHLAGGLGRPRGGDQVADLQLERIVLVDEEALDE